MSRQCDNNFFNHFYRFQSNFACTAWWFTVVWNVPIVTVLVHQNGSFTIIISVINFGTWFSQVIQKFIRFPLIIIQLIIHLINIHSSGVTPHWRNFILQILYIIQPKLNRTLHALLHNLTPQQWKTKINIL